MKGKYKHRSNGSLNSQQSGGIRNGVIKRAKRGKNDGGMSTAEKDKEKNLLEKLIFDSHEKAMNSIEEFGEEYERDNYGSNSSNRTEMER
jgi:hypothetical protein